jgi:hypothetical protein
MAKQKTPQKISIVFEDTGGDGFNVYMEGHTRKFAHVNERDLSPSEWWAAKMFSIVTDLMKKAGAVKTITERPDGSGVKQ